MRLYRYILRRMLLILPVIIGVSIFVFMLTRIAGDPVAAYVSSDKVPQHQIELIREKYHLNEPVWTQFWYWFEGLINGDWGYSRVDSKPVVDAIIYRFPATFELAMVSMTMSVLVGIWLGTKAAVKKDRAVDQVTRVTSLVGVSIPVFWLGLLLLMLFYGQLGLFPIGKRISDSYVISGTGPDGLSGFFLLDSILMGDPALFLDVAWHLVLPAITLAFAGIAIIMRIQRNSMLEVLSLDYVKTARAKGLDEKTVINKHARRNALIPTTTVVGMAFGGLLGGAVLTETIFSWPGLGRFAAMSIQRLDTASILGFCMLVAFIYIIVNLAVDIIYAYLDPRVRLE